MSLSINSPHSDNGYVVMKSFDITTNFSNASVLLGSVRCIIYARFVDAAIVIYAFTSADFPSSNRSTSIPNPISCAALMLTQKTIVKLTINEHIVPIAYSYNVRGAMMKINLLNG